MIADKNILGRDGEYEIRIEVHTDKFAQNPYELGDLLTEFVCWHRDYALTTDDSKHYDKMAPEEVLADLRKRFQKKGPNGVLFYALVGAYIHGGIALNLGGIHPNWPDQQWDCGIFGVVYITRQQFNQLVGRATKKRLGKISDMARGEVEALSQYLNGEVYTAYVEVRNLEGSIVFDESLSGCWGDPDSIIEMAMAEMVPKEYRHDA